MSRFFREYAESVVPLPRSELIRRGISRGVLAGPHWQRTAYGLYVPAGELADHPTPTQRIISAWSQLPPGAVIGGWAAAYASGVDALDGQDSVTFQQLPVTAIVPADLHRTPNRELRCVRDQLPGAQTYEQVGIRWTREHRTALDLARWAPDLTEAVVALDAILAARVVKREALVQAADRWLRGQRGARQARRAIELCRVGTRSTWESRLRMLYVLDLGFPCPLVNQPVFDTSGSFLGIPDLLDPEAGLAAEFDGAGHREREQHRRDNVREELLERARLIVTRADSLDLRRHRRQLGERLTRARAEGLRRNRSLDRWTTVEPPNWIGMPG